MRISITRTISLEDLQQLHRVEKNARIRDRLLMVIFVKKGNSARKTAELLGYDKDTVCQWVNRFNMKGLQGLVDKPKSGRPSKIDYQKLEEVLNNSPQDIGLNYEAWFPKLVYKYLTEHQNINIHFMTTYKAIERLDMKLLVPRPISYESDPEKVAQFKKK